MQDSSDFLATTSSVNHASVNTTLSIRSEKTQRGESGLQGTFMRGVVYIKQKALPEKIFRHRQEKS